MALPIQVPPYMCTNIPTLGNDVLITHTRMKRCGEKSPPRLRDYFVFGFLSLSLSSKFGGPIQISRRPLLKLLFAWPESAGGAAQRRDSPCVCDDLLRNLWGYVCFIREFRNVVCVLRKIQCSSRRVCDRIGLCFRSLRLVGLLRKVVGVSFFY